MLDVCCGTGLMDAELLKLGYSVVGTDASAAMLTRARARVGPQAQFLLATLPDLPVDETFDAAISTFDGLNYLTPEVFQASVKVISEHLRVGAWLCFDLHTDAMMDFTLKNAQISGEEEGHFFSIRSEVDPEQRTCSTWIAVTTTESGSHFTEHHRQHFHSDAFVREVLNSAGFTEIRIVEEYTDTPANADTLRATWISRKTQIGVTA